MKEIKAIIRPAKLLEVTEELHAIDGLPGVTVSEIKGFGKSRAQNAQDRIVYEVVELVPRIQLEVVVDEDMVEEVVSVIRKHAHTGTAGDGMRYQFTRTLHVKAGTHRTVMAIPADAVAVEKEITLVEGSRNTLVLEPVYGKMPVRSRPWNYNSTDFKEGIRSLRVVFNGKEK